MPPTALRGSPCHRAGGTLLLNNDTLVVHLVAAAAIHNEYANYLDDPTHLIVVTAGANRSKGAGGPDEWKPRDED